jgi:hypothetical protein
MSGVLNALYVRGDDLEKVRARYADEYDVDGVEGRVGPAFICVEAGHESDFVDDPDLSADSEAFGEAILLQLTSFGDDVFRYDHWREGRLARRVHYAPGAWVRVEGVPEPWEERAFLDTPKKGKAPRLDTHGVLAAMIKHLGLPTLWPR